MSNFLSFLILAVSATLQASLVPQIRLLSGGPDFVFLLVMVWAMSRSLEESVVWAFAGGIMLDLLSYNPTGTSVLGMLILVFLIHNLGEQVYRIGFVILVGLVLVGTLFQHLVIMMILTISGFPVDWITGLTYVVMPTIVYNLIFIWPILWFVRRFER